jgi:uncharacterized protein (TIGR02302 family)
MKPAILVAMSMDQISNDRLPGLTRVRLVTGLAILFERLWPLVLPAIITGSAVLTLSWFGLFRSVPDVMRFAFLGVLGAALLASLWPLRTFRLPTPQDIDARLEAANTLSHQPIAAQTDRPAGSPDDFANALWREHQRRMAQKLSGIQSANPLPRTYEHDRFALRAIPALGLFVAFAFSQGSLGGKFSDIWNGPAAIPPVPPRIDAWVTPPRYTGKAPLFLSGLTPEPGQSFTVPENSELTIRIGNEAPGDFSLAIDGNPMRQPAAGVAPAAVPGKVLKGVLASDGTVTLQSTGKPIAAWAFKVIEDKPPVIAFTADPSAASNGSLSLAYKITDDYGAMKAVAEFAPAEPAQDARPLFDMADVALSVPRRSTGDGSAKTAKDLTEHPLGRRTFLHHTPCRGWCRPDGGERGENLCPAGILFCQSTVPRSWRKTAALLARNANDKPLVLDYLDALMTRPDDTLANASYFLGIKTARLRLAAARDR